jgi:hypothetical protein
MTELLRVLPMSVQDLVDEWFEYEPLKAAIAAAGVRDIRQGPRSGGTSFVLLHHLGWRAGRLGERAWLVARRARRVHRDCRGAGAKGGRGDPDRRLCHANHRATTMP